MKITILDDSRTDAYVATQVAKNFFEVVEVHGTPGEFHAALKVDPQPDLILMDVHIGDLHNGISELANLKERYTAASSIPVIVVTASTDVSLHAFAVSNGADAVIVKPISVDKLLPILKQVLPHVIFEGV